MKTIKRTVAALLATLMLATSTSFVLAAEEYSDAEAVVVAKVNAAGIMTGTDKGFEPSKSLTRAEAAAIIVRMKGISESATKAMAGTTLFNDVAASHWASGYVNEASNLGIVKGVSATEFAPDREVTVAEFVTMAVRALGAGQLVDSEGTWPTNYVNFANENDILKDVNNIYTAVATRLQAATIVANTLEAPIWEKSAVKSNGEITWEAKEKTIIENVLKFITKEANGENLSITVEKVSNIDKTINGVECIDTLDLSNIKVGMTYECWLNEDEEIAGLWIPTNKDRIEFSEIKKYETKTGKDIITLVVDGKEKEYKIDDVTENAQNVLINLPSIVKNEKSVTYEASDLATLLKADKNIDGIAYLEDGIISSIYITNYTYYGIVEKVTDKKITFLGAADKVTVVNNVKASEFKLNDEEKEYFLTKDGKAMSFSDLEEGDAIRYYTVDTDKVVAEVITPVVSGTIKNINDDDHYVKVDGTKYDYLYTEESGSVVPNKTLSGLKLNQEVELYVNQANKVVMYKEIKEAAGDVAVVKSMKWIKDKYGDENAEVTLFLLDGQVTDTLTVDAKETKKNYNSSADIAFAVATSSTYATMTIDLATDVVIKPGSVVCYEIKGDKVEFSPVSDTDPEFVPASASMNLKVNENTKSYIEVSSSAKAFVDSSVKFIEVKAKADDFDEVKVSLVSFDDLDAKTTALNATSYLVNYDADAKTVDALVYNVTIDRAKEYNFAVVTAKSKTEVDDETAYEYDVIYTDGTKATYYATNDSFGTGFDGLLVGTAYDIAVSDDELTSAETEVEVKAIAALASADNTADNIKTIKDIDTEHNEITVGSTDYAVSSDVLVLEKDGSKYIVRELVDISEIDAFVAGDEVDKLVKVFQAKDDDDNDEIVIIIFDADVTVE